MRYFGSKVSTVQEVYRLVEKRIPSGVLCDPFGGIGTVGSYFKERGYSVWCGDILTFAHHFQAARVTASKVPTLIRLREALGLRSVAQILEILNQARVRGGWLVREYAQKRRFFTLENARRIEACRHLIQQWAANQLLSRSERGILLASLINSMDRVANTAGTYYAYLKSWHRKARLPFCFELIPYTRGSAVCRSFIADADSLVGIRDFDILYLDPPYNDRSYAGYYHLPETLARGETPRTHGVAGIPDLAFPSSDFNRPGKAAEALERVLARATFRLLVFHYSDQGLIRPKRVRQILSSYGKIAEVVSVVSKGYTTAVAPRVVMHRVYVVSRA